MESNIIFIKFLKKNKIISSVLEYFFKFHKFFPNQILQYIVDHFDKDVVFAFIDSNNISYYYNPNSYNISITYHIQVKNSGYVLLNELPFKFRYKLQNVSTSKNRCMYHCLQNISNETDIDILFAIIQNELDNNKKKFLDLQKSTVNGIGKSMGTENILVAYCKVMKLNVLVYFPVMNIFIPYLYGNKNSKIHFLYLNHNHYQNMIYISSTVNIGLGDSTNYNKEFVYSYSVHVDRKSPNKIFTSLKAPVWGKPIKSK